MPIVTQLTLLPRPTGRVAVDVDGVTIGVVPVDVVGRLGLVTRGEITSETAALLADETAALRTYDRALRLLAARGRSIRELRRRLVMAKEPEPSIDLAIERLTSSGLLDDAEYARQVARSRIVGRGHAPRRLKQELAKRGVARDVADRAIDLVMSEDAAPGSFGADAGIDLTATIEKLARRKLRSLASVDSQTRSRRLYAFLARRGYESGDIRAVLSRLDAEEITAPDSA